MHNQNIRHRDQSAIWCRFDCVCVWGAYVCVDLLRMYMRWVIFNATPRLIHHRNAIFVYVCVLVQCLNFEENRIEKNTIHLRSSHEKANFRVVWHKRRDTQTHSYQSRYSRSKYKNPIARSNSTHTHIHVHIQRIQPYTYDGKLILQHILNERAKEKQQRRDSATEIKIQPDKH